MSLFPPNLATRRRQAEWMDETTDERMLRDSLRFIRRVNALLGYRRAILGHLQRMSRHWKPGERITLLDLATGSADIPHAMLTWADQYGWDLHVTAIDRHPITLDEARTRSAHPRLHLLQADVFDLPFEAGSFDYVTTAMFLHHLDDRQVIDVMRTMDRLARRGVIISDLLRHRRAYAWIRLFTLFSSPMVKHDATISVAQAFRKREIEDLRTEAGLAYTVYYRHFGHRFVLCGEKPAAIGVRRQ